jgi:site-specific DNA recombinase
MAKRRTHTQNNLRAIGYVRVSTDDQGISRDMQIERVTQYCAFKGFELVEVVVDDDTTSRIELNKRPNGQRIAGLLASGVAHIVAIKLDRLWRNAGEALNDANAWERRGISLHLTEQAIDTATSAGKCFFTMLSAFAEMERNQISERVVSALGYKRSKGERMGNTPYGWSADLNTRNADGRTTHAALLVENPTEQAVIAQIRTLRASGMSLQAIAGHLNDAGIRTRRGTPWRLEYVHSIVRSTAVAA